MGKTKEWRGAVPTEQVSNLARSGRRGRVSKWEWRMPTLVMIHSLIGSVHCYSLESYRFLPCLWLYSLEESKYRCLHSYWLYVYLLFFPWRYAVTEVNCHSLWDFVVCMFYLTPCWVHSSSSKSEEREPTFICLSGDFTWLFAAVVDCPFCFHPSRVGSAWRSVRSPECKMSHVGLLPWRILHPLSKVHNLVRIWTFLRLSSLGCCDRKLRWHYHDTHYLVS
jgi:hypothetical protein